MNIESIQSLSSFPEDKLKLLLHLDRKMYSLIEQVKSSRSLEPYKDKIQQIANQIIKLKADWYLGTPGVQYICPRRFFLTCYKPGTKKVELKKSNIVLHAAFSIIDNKGDVIGDKWQIVYSDDQDHKIRARINARIPESSLQKFYNPLVFCEHLDTIQNNISIIEYEPQNMGKTLRDFYTNNKPFKYVYTTPLKYMANNYLELVLSIHQPNRDCFTIDDYATYHAQGRTV